MICSLTSWSTKCSRKHINVSRPLLVTWVLCHRDNCTRVVRRRPQPRTPSTTPNDPPPTTISVFLFVQQFVNANFLHALLSCIVSALKRPVICFVQVRHVVIMTITMMTYHILESKSHCQHIHWCVLYKIRKALPLRKHIKAQVLRQTRACAKPIKGQIAKYHARAVNVYNQTKKPHTPLHS